MSAASLSSGGFLDFEPMWLRGWPDPTEGGGVRKEFIAPLTGVAFVVVLVTGFLIAGEPPEAKDSTAQEIVQHYVDHKDSAIAGAFLSALAALFLVFFGGHLRRVLRAAEGENGMLSAVAFAGTIIVAVAAAIDATISLALAETAKDLDPSAAQALEALWDNDFIPVILGTVILLFAAGISIVLNGGLPRWLGWVAITLGVLGATPLGFVAFLGSGVWILVLSIVLTMQAGNPSSSAPPASTQ
jgi:hypothetical protein